MIAIKFAARSTLRRSQSSSGAPPVNEYCTEMQTEGLAGGSAPNRGAACACLWYADEKRPVCLAVIAICGVLQGRQHEVRQPASRGGTPPYFKGPWFVSDGGAPPM